MRRTLCGSTPSRSAKILDQLMDLRSSSVLSSRLRSSTSALAGWRNTDSSLACSVVIARSCVLRRSTATRVSFIRLRSEAIRNNSTPSSPVSSTAQTSDVNRMGRSRRKGSLERLIGMRISAFHQFHISEQACVERAGRAEAAAELFLLAVQAVWGAVRKPAQDQLAGGRSEFVFDIGEGRMQDREDLLFTGFFQHDAAEQFDGASGDHGDGEYMARQFGEHDDPIAAIEVQSGQGGSGDDARLKTGVAEQGLISRDDFERHGDGDDFDFLTHGGGLNVVAYSGRVDVEGNRFLDAEADQGELLVGGGRERIEIEHGDARGIVGQNDGGGAALLRSVHGRELFDHGGDGIAAKKIVCDRRGNQRARFDRLKNGLTCMG